MSKTPRVDDREFAAIDLKPSSRVVYASFARQLETELADKDKQLAEALAEIETELADKDKQLAEALAEIERKDALIEQMREALRLALPEARSTHVEQTILAALAAERGE